MAAGTQAFELEGAYDPRTMTLDEFLTLYETESVKGGRKGNKNWGNLIRNNPIAKQYLNQPALTLFGAVPTSQETGSIMADMQNAQIKSAPTLQSKFRVIEANIFKRLQAIAKKEKLPSLLVNYSPISVDVKKLKTRGGLYTAKFGFDVNKIGELVRNLEKHVAQFPEDKPIANAILFNLENGSRPGLTTEIRTVHYQPSLFGVEAETMGFEKRPGLLIPAGTKGVKRQAKGQVPNVQPYNAPLSKRAITILQDQSDYNSKIIGDDIKLDNYFQVTDKRTNKPRPLDLSKDVNRVLEATSPDGIIIEYTEEGAKPTKTPLKSKQIRNLYLNTAALAIDDKVNIAMLTNRDVPENVGSQEIYMGKPGQYKSSALADLEKVSMTNWGFYSLNTTEARDNYKKGLIRNPNEFIFGDNTPEKNKVVEYVDMNDVQVKNIPIQQSGKSFEPSLEGKTTKTTQPDLSPSVDGEELKTNSLKEKLAKFNIDYKGLGVFGAALTLASVPTMFRDAYAENIEALEKEGLKPIGDESDPSFRAKVSGTIGPEFAAGLETAGRVLDPGIELATDVVDTAGAYVARAREVGLPQASSEFGLARDQGFVREQNIQRRQRLADRVKRNTSVTSPEDQGFINQNQMGE